jgi:RimJ/RimL family protein N-acetyltransferase
VSTSEKPLSPIYWPFFIVTDPQVRLTRRGDRRLLFAPPRNAQHSADASIVRMINIGHVNHLHFDVGKQHVYCGWNLTPDYRGRGITVLALSKLFDQFFREQQISR